jgi:hypothetical protein
LTGTQHKTITSNRGFNRNAIDRNFFLTQFSTDLKAKGQIERTWAYMYPHVHVHFFLHKEQSSQKKERHTPFTLNFHQGEKSIKDGERFVGRMVLDQLKFSWDRHLRGESTRGGGWERKTADGRLMGK